MKNKFAATLVGLALLSSTLPALAQPWLGQPPSSGTDLHGDSQELPGLSVDYVLTRGPTAEIIQSDGALFLLTTRGVLTRVRSDTLVEEKLFAYSGHRSLSQSRRGLVLVYPAAPNRPSVLRLVDPNTLMWTQYKWLDYTPRLTAAAPASDTIFVTNDADDTLVQFDVKRWSVVATHTAASLGAPSRKHPQGSALSDFQKIAMSPNGRHLLVLSNDTLHRFVVTKSGLKYAEAGARIGWDPQRIEISPDGRYVALPSKNGNHGGMSGHPSVPPFSTFVYKLGNLQRPLLSTTTGQFPRALGFDRGARLIYGQNLHSQLVLIDTKGNVTREFSFTDAEVTRIVTGKRTFLVLTGAGEPHLVRVTIR